jgi:hypothetical protein
MSLERFQQNKILQPITLKTKKEKVQIASKITGLTTNLRKLTPEP